MLFRGILLASTVALLGAARAHALDLRGARDSIVHDLRTTANGMRAKSQYYLLSGLSPDDYAGLAGDDRLDRIEALRLSRYDEAAAPVLSDDAWIKQFAPRAAARLETEAGIAGFLAATDAWIRANGADFEDASEGRNFLRPLIERVHQVRDQLPEGLSERADLVAVALTDNVRADERTAASAAEAPIVVTAAAAEDRAPEVRARLAPAPAASAGSEEDLALREAWRKIVVAANEEERATRERQAKYGLTLRESIQRWADRSPWGQPFFYDPDKGVTAFDSAIAASKKMARKAGGAAQAVPAAAARWTKERFRRGAKDEAKTERPALRERLRAISARKLWDAIQERRKLAREAKAQEKAERGPLRPARAEEKKKKPAEPSLWREVWNAKSPRPAIERFKKWLLTPAKKKQDPPSFAADKTLSAGATIVPIELSKRQRLERQARRIALTMSDLASAMGGSPRVVELRDIGDAVSAARFDPLSPEGSTLHLDFQAAFTAVHVTVRRAPYVRSPGRDAMALELRVADETEPFASFWIEPGSAPRLLSKLDAESLEAAEQLLKLAEDSSTWLFIWQAPRGGFAPRAASPAFSPALAR